MIPVNGIDLSYYEWNQELKGNAPSLLFIHATGFHARVWDEIISMLPDRHGIAVDIRCHGRSGGDIITKWQSCADDVVALLDHLKLDHWHGIGHSMGGHILARIAYNQPESFQSLVLIDPVIAAPDRYDVNSSWFPKDQPHPTVFRKRWFASADEMYQRFRNKEPYSNFSDASLRAYCEFGLTPRIDGEDGLELACSPEAEASVYMSSQDNGDILDIVRRLKTPTTIVRAPVLEGMNFKSSPTWPELANILPDGTDIQLADETHFMPFESPSRIADIIRDAIA